jgi:hypothetical protein
MTTQRREIPMPDISLPDIHLPDMKLPEGLRDMKRQDIQNAIGDRWPRKIEMPDVDLSKVDLSKVDLSKVDLSKIELPKSVEKRLPGRRRTNPILPIAAIVAIGSLVAAAWWLITSPTAMVRVRDTADRLRARLNGPLELERFDDEQHLGSLLPEPNETRPSVEAETWPDTFSDVGDEVRSGNGSGVTQSAEV